MMQAHAQVCKRPLDISKLTSQAAWRSLNINRSIQMTLVTATLNDQTRLTASAYSDSECEQVAT